MVVSPKWVDVLTNILVTRTPKMAALLLGHPYIFALLLHLVSVHSFPEMLAFWGRRSCLRSRRNMMEALPVRATPRNSCLAMCRSVTFFLFMTAQVVRIFSVFHVRCSWRAGKQERTESNNVMDDVPVPSYT